MHGFLHGICRCFTGARPDHVRVVSSSRGFPRDLRPVQTLATLLGPTCCERLHTMLCVVACCCDLLEVVG